jgi:hypothetical protein
MDKKIKFIPCDEKTLIGANQQEVINKNKSYKDKNVAS